MTKTLLEQYPDICGEQDFIKRWLYAGKVERVHPNAPVRA